MELSLSSLVKRIRAWCPKITILQSANRTRLSRDRSRTVFTLALITVFFSSALAVAWWSRSMNLPVDSHPPEYARVVTADGVLDANPVLISCLNGSYLLAFYRSGSIYVCSSENGLDWTLPEQATHGLDQWHLSLFQCIDSSYMMAFPVNLENMWSINVTKSETASTWAEPVSVLTTERSLGDVSMIQYKDGSFMIAYVVDDSGIEVITSREGLTWSDPSVAAQGQYAEVSLVRTSNGSTIIATTGYGGEWSGDILLLESHDKTTWHEYRAISVSYIDSGPCIAQSNESAFVIGYSSHASKATRIYLTQLIRDLPDRTCAFWEMIDCKDPSIVQLTDGSYMVAFSSRGKVWVTRLGFPEEGKLARILL